MMEIDKEEQKILAQQFPQNPAIANKILCCICGLPFEAITTKTNICLQCLVSSQDITEGITKQGIIAYCRQCHRYQKPPWMNCGRESKELLSICLKKIRGLQRVKLLDAAFIWTEEHCRRIKIKLTIQKEILTGINIQETFQVEFEEHYTQCEDCKREFTPHTWGAVVQARQHVNHKKTFYLLEQMILKHNAHENCLKVKEAPEGLDFFFKNKMQALGLIDFIQQFIPAKQKMAKQLVSADIHSNITNYKYCYSLTFPKICKEDLIIIPEKLKNELGGCSQVLLCLKVSNFIRCYDPINNSIIDINSNQYFNFEKDIECIPFKGNQQKFMIVNIEHDFTKKPQQDKKQQEDKKQQGKKYLKQLEDYNMEVSRCSDWQNFNVKSHLPPNLQCGVSLLGFDLTALNQAQFDLSKSPDIIIVKKERLNRQERRRIWRLKRLDIEMQDENNFHKKSAKKNDDHYEEFLEEIEQDKDIRQDINLYADEEGIKQRKQKLQEKNKEKSNKRQPNNRQIIKVKKRQEIKELKKAKQQEEEEKKAQEELNKEDEWEDIGDDSDEDDQAVKITELLKDMKLEDNQGEQIEGNQQDMLINQFISQLEKVKIEGTEKDKNTK